MVTEKYNRANGFEEDCDVVYGDTDSVMVNFRVESNARAMELGREAAEYISATFIKPIKLEFEKAGSATSHAPYVISALRTPACTEKSHGQAGWAGSTPPCTCQSLQERLSHLQACILLKSLEQYNLAAPLGRNEAPTWSVCPHVLMCAGECGCCMPSRCIVHTCSSARSAMLACCGPTQKPGIRWTPRCASVHVVHSLLQGCKIIDAGSDERINT